jgi:pimeloyl-ACP methyl ester carboxylesterase
MPIARSLSTAAATARSKCDARPYTYELLASDALAVLNQLRVKKAAMVGWSYGASHRDVQ